MPTEPFLGELALYPYNQTPQGWLRCDGQTLPINGNQALFSLIGTTFGGNGTTNFQLPDLRGRCALGAGTDPHSGTPFPQGQPGGQEMVTLTLDQVPAHNHTVEAVAANGGTSTPANTTLLAQGNASSFGSVTPFQAYSTQPPDQQMGGGIISPAGGGAGHYNVQPFSVMAWFIAINGAYPPRD
ncbi:Microcystin dependent protein [Caenispirillum salinarum AK4]|uniref:Microcystin dependent protein n=1 Tax=Caenispirillum salinarum AK4 TaxID=1238182 RepID=K9GWM2_9PROT|nr:tail fiber protein [Caenispirillum salinarum]EKV29134.1 Microcystin dependent protein [Caenispirillum salinarum AK4]